MWGDDKIPGVASFISLTSVSSVWPESAQHIPCMLMLMVIMQSMSLSLCKSEAGPRLQLYRQTDDGRRIKDFKKTIKHVFPSSPVLSRLDNVCAVCGTDLWVFLWFPSTFPFQLHHSETDLRVILVKHLDSHMEIESYQIKSYRLDEWWWWRQVLSMS